VAELFVDLGRIALGLTTFSWALWAYVSVLFLIVGPTFVQVAPKVIDPPATLLATDPVRVVIWMPISVIGSFMLTLFLLITIFGAMLMPILAILVGMAGYLALSRLIGERIGNALGMAEVAPWLASALGIVVLRLVRLVPILGAPAHSLLAWIGFAAASCATVTMARSWYRRRLPDEEQFRGEMLVEWYPDGDPADGRPSIGTGRPVLDNVRGDEDRAPKRADELENEPEG
jgi:hypothetical protein